MTDVVNPWHRIPLAEYESHMSLPKVGQAHLLADLFECALREYLPDSVAVLGCSGGNGFERISTAITTRVVGVDINEAYLRELRTRFETRIPRLELVAGDIQSAEVSFAPVQLVFAALLLEYVDVEVFVKRVPALLTRQGVLRTVIQLPSPAASAVTPSVYSSLQSLTQFMRLVSPDYLERVAAEHGFAEVARELAASPGGKQFQVQSFRISERPNAPARVRCG